jgi:hypothetical protein
MFIWADLAHLKLRLYKILMIGILRIRRTEQYTHKLENM